MHPLVRLLPGLSIALAVLLGWLVLAFVDLTPRVDERFFFAPDSPTQRENKSLQQKFLSQQLLVVTAHAPDIAGDRYRQRIERLTRELESLRYVLHVKSVTQGPDDLEDARSGPMWRRLLLLPGVSATNLVLAVDTTDNPQLIESVTRVLRDRQRPDFRLSLAGVPYVIDSISRNLRVDFRNFSLAAIGVFSVLMLVLFRSGTVLLGSLTACAIAALSTLLVQHLLGGRIGLLTANLVTISFVLTQSHIVFMTNNWRRLRPGHDRPEETLRHTLRQTFTASAWCMVAAVLGFASLLYVEAQPLRELGFGGTLATLCAIGAAYGVYPWFLLRSRLRGAPAKKDQRPRWLTLPRAPVAAGIVLLGLGTGVGAAWIDSDPSLFAYFDPRSKVYRDLMAVDPHGGSSPLNLAVRRNDRKRLDNDESYERMWNLQRALQRDPAVGSVLSLPVLMAEAQRTPLAKVLPWNWILDLLSQPHYARVARGFITDDRVQGLYLLRMTESTREERRTEIIERLQNTVEAQGFEVVAVGGTYALQGRLADLVTRSLLEGLAGLLLAVALIAFAVTRSAPAALAMLACAATVPAVALGLFGVFRIPLDIIATPGINVAVGVAVDSMIHLGAAWRREFKVRPAPQALAEAQRDQAGGILAFSAVVVAGFAIFAASTFPPTQRFGLAVILGAATAGAMALWVFPGLLTRVRRAGAA
ncbi:MAG: efflux RND transporter permease subunit [Woeseiaceae bacterium]